jgi:mono/diheme cytochrome c family protein
MPVHIRRLTAGLGLLGFCLSLPAAPASEPEPAVFFEQKVRPILQASCFTCHSHAAKKSKGGLMLDARDSLLKGGDRGPALVPGKPDESLLLKAVGRHDEDLKMPPAGKLTEEQIATLRDWIKMGAPWSAKSEATAAKPRGTITDEDRRWWAFQPVKQFAVPEIRDPKSEIRNPIDAFVLAKLQAAGLTPAPTAGRRALIRRVTFDLIGLPPSPAEVDAFVNDQSTDAYEKVVDRLLESPRYGERSARIWFDIARYAESDGFKSDDERAGAWRYRDYVIQSFHADKPYDRFLKEQLAGDEIAPDDPDALVATGFLRAGCYEYNNRDVPGQWDSILNELTDTVGDAVLGLGMGCARCHDHKFDPILQKDYYRLRAFFAGLSAREDIPVATERQHAEYRAKLVKWEAETKDIRAKIEALEAPIRAKVEKDVVIKLPEEIQVLLAKPVGERTPYEQQIADLAYRQVTYEFHRLDTHVKGDAKKTRDQLRKELAKFDADRPTLPEGMSARDMGPVAAPTKLPKSGAVVEPGVPSIFDTNPLPVTAGKATTGRRTALADWLTRPENPLTARVAVNRVWQQHFGRGLVATSSDFGHLGETPSHPELLDWLTKQFVDGGWHFKQLHREIVLSQAYRQSVADSPAAVRTDPENRLISHAVTRRLEAEQVRDGLLAVTGKLDLAAGGPSAAASEPRRTVYTKVKRNTRDPLLDLFDVPESFTSTSQRNVTTTPMQALLMVNSPFMLRQAEALATRLRKEHPADETARLDAAYRLTFARPPTDAERRRAVAFLDEQAKRLTAGKDGRAAAWTDLCHVLLNANEFLYVD